MSFPNLQKISEMLLKEWDPIGISDTPGAEDEYSQYADTVNKIIQNSHSYKELFEYLWNLETEYMGLTGNRIKTEEFAKMLFNQFKSPKLQN